MRKFKYGIAAILLASTFLTPLQAKAGLYKFGADFATSASQDIVSSFASDVVLSQSDSEELAVDFTDRAIQSLANNIIKKTLKVSLKAAESSGLLTKGSQISFLDDLETIVRQQYAKHMNSKGGKEFLRGKALGFAKMVAVSVAIDVTAEVWKSYFYDTNSALANGGAFVIKQSKVVYAAQTGGPVGAVVAQGFIAYDALSDAYGAYYEMVDAWDAAAESANLALFQKRMVQINRDYRTAETEDGRERAVLQVRQMEQLLIDGGMTQSDAARFLDQRIQTMERDLQQRDVVLNEAIDSIRLMEVPGLEYTSVHHLT